MKLKKIIHFFIVFFCCILCLCEHNIQAESGKATFFEGPYTYIIENSEAVLLSCDSNTVGEIIVPSVLGGFSLTRIEYEAFENCKHITSITIPESVLSIGYGAFSYCEELTEVNYPPLFLPLNINCLTIVQI